MTYDSLNTYATTADLQQRTTDQGYINLADRDGDGSVDAGELTDVEQSIESANQVIDAAMQNFMAPDAARTASNDWLRDRCVDIAVYNVATLGGRMAPDAWVVLRDEAVDYLNRVARGTLRVPRLTYPDPAGKATQSTRGVPHAINRR